MFKLALKLGYTVRELSNKLTSKELSEWLAYYSIEPWGEEVKGLRSALQCATTANSALLIANPKRLKRKPFTPKDFLVGIRNETKSVKSWEDQKEIMNSHMKKVNLALSKKGMLA